MSIFSFLPTFLAKKVGKNAHLQELAPAIAFAQTACRRKGIIYEALRAGLEAKFVH